MLFSVVMPTFNRRETLEKVLPSIANQNFQKEDYEILLSDSGSTDGTAEMLEKLGIPNLRFIQGENRGRSGARNRGIESARGEIILFTDADIIADPDLLCEHARFHRQKSPCALVGCEVQVASLEEYERVKGKRELFRTLHPPQRERLSWLYFLTGNASARKEDLIRVGCFDEDFTGYGHEDLELGYRLQKAGIPIYHNSRAINYHWHPVPFEEDCRKRQMAGVSTVRFYNKHRDPAIKLNLGWNPFNMFWQGLISEEGPTFRWMKSKAEGSRFFRELVLQYYWVSGIKTALKNPD